MKIETLRCDSIEATAATQIRVRLDKDVIDAYCEDYKSGADFPAIVVFREKNSERAIMADGFHRHRGRINAGFDDIDCEVHEGGMHEALLYALGCNFDHGLRRTNADKRHAVEMALKDPEIGRLSRQEIADICRVTKRTVQKLANTKDIEAPENGAKVKGEPKKPNGNDFRDTGKAPTQAEIDLDELRQACKLIGALPYAGDDADLDFTPDDIDDLEYVSTWTAEVVIKARSNAA